jgi:PAS domain-containing protein
VSTTILPLLFERLIHPPRFHSALISKQDSAHSTTSDASNPNAYDAFRASGSHHSPPDFSSPFTAHVNPQEQPPPQIEVPALYTSDLSHAPPVITPPSSLPSLNTAQHVFSNALVPHPIPPFPITAPSAVGLPVYSTSGFDIISILSRIINRPNPTVHLGPVDFSCSFAIADARRHDCPIVYASPTFYRLTGYSEDEVVGRNCRFLQSPMGHVAKNETRRFVSPEAVSYMRKSLSSFKECQTSLINYRKGGQAFINLVTIIPLRGGVHNLPEEADEVVYFVGFQVDLTEQPSRILEKLRDGSYCTNYSTWGMNGIPGDLGLPGLGQGLGQALGQLQQAQNVANIGVRGGKHGPMMSIVVSKELRSLIADTTFTDSVPISTGTNISGTTGTAEQGGNSTTTLAALATSAASGGVASSSAMNQNLTASGSSTPGSMSPPLSPSLSLLLLELLPDFLLVLSLKGSFLYVAPSVRLVLGYEPHELVGRSISDVCHPADLVPLMRELKEGSVSGMSAAGTLGGEGGTVTGMGSNVHPKPVDLLFRALPKTSTFSPFTQEPSSTEHGDPQTQAQSTSSDPSPSWDSHPNGSSGLVSITDSSSRSTSPPPYVWLECRGRLHVEPGKGRKAIILSGRARWMPVVRWGDVGKAGSISSLRGQGVQSRGGSSTSAGTISSFSSCARYDKSELHYVTQARYRFPLIRLRQARASNQN